MVVDELVVDQAVVYLGGSIAASTLPLDSPILRQDLDFLVTKIQPATGTPELEAVSLLKGASGKWFVRFTNKIEMRNERDCYYDHIIWFSEEQLIKSGLDLDLLKSYFFRGHPSSLPKSIEKLRLPITPTDCKTLVKEYVTNELLLHAIYEALFSAANNRGKLVFVCRPAYWEPIWAIMQSLPRQLRMVPFLGYAEIPSMDVAAQCTSIANFRKSFYDEISGRDGWTVIDLINQKAVQQSSPRQGRLQLLAQRLAEHVFEDDIAYILRLQEYLDRFPERGIETLEMLLNACEAFEKLDKLEQALPNIAVSMHIDYAEAIKPLRPTEATEHLREAARKAMTAGDGASQMHLISKRVYELDKDVFFENVSNALAASLTSYESFRKTIDNLTYVNEMDRLHSTFFGVVGRTLTQENLQENPIVLENLADLLLLIIRKDSRQCANVLRDLNLLSGFSVGPGLSDKIREIQAEAATIDVRFRTSLSIANPLMMSNIFVAKSSLANLVWKDVLTATHLGANGQKSLLRQYYVLRPDLFREQFVTFYKNFLARFSFSNLDSSDAEIIARIFAASDKNDLMAQITEKWSAASAYHLSEQAVTDELNWICKARLISEANIAFVAAQMISYLRNRAGLWLERNNRQYYLRDSETTVKMPAWLNLLCNVVRRDHILAAAISSNSKLSSWIDRTLKKYWTVAYDEMYQSLSVSTIEEKRAALTRLIELYVEAVERPLAHLGGCLNEKAIGKLRKFGFDCFAECQKALLLERS